MTQPKPHKAIAVLDLAISVHDQIGLTKAILVAMTGNGHFKSPTPTLATVATHTAALEASQVVALTKAVGTAAARNAVLVTLRDDLHFLKAYVQSIANADLANAAAIILSAGMTVKKPNTRFKQDIVAKQGAVSGLVLVVAKAAAARASYDWQCSSDQKTWTTLPTTLRAHTSVSNLVPGTTVYFRHRSVTKAGVSDWGEVTSLIVK